MPTADKGSTAETAPTATQRVPANTNTISFVAFEGSANNASRRAVRKQAALSSAAARKATIAKKVAQQKADDEVRKSGKAKEAQAQKDVRPETSVEKRDVGQETSAKRKRSVDAGQQRRVGIWQHGLIIEMPDVRRKDKGSNDEQQKTPALSREHSTAFATSPGRSIGELLEHAESREASPAVSPAASTMSLSRQFARIVPAYLSPSQTAGELSDDFSRRPSNTSQADAQDVDAEDITQYMVRRRGNWPVMADDLEAYDDSNTLPLTPESLASPNSRAASIMDPFNQWPVDYHPIYDRLLYHMMHVYAPRGWPALSISDNEGRRWEHFMTQHALAEPALFLVRVLFASGDLINSGQMEAKVAVQLRALAIKAINDALTDEVRSISDGLILAVGRIALTEALFGDKLAAHTMHRPAQRRMISLRGGMGALHFPPLVKRLMRWADKVMSMQGGTPRFLPDDEDQGNTTFNMAQSVGVLDSWAPAEGRAIRQKIAIADLIT